MTRLIFVIIIGLFTIISYIYLKNKLKSKPRIWNVFRASILIVAFVLCFWILGFRLSPLQASMANKFVEDDAELLENIEVDQNYFHMYYNPEEELYRTTYTKKVGLLYRSNSSTWFYPYEEDSIRTIGGSTVLMEENNLSVLYVITEDKQVAEIAVIDSDGNYVTRQQVKSQEPCIVKYKYPVDATLPDYKIAALNDEQDAIYYYGYEPNDNPIGYSEYKWHVAKNEKLDSKFNTKIKSGNLVTNYNIDRVLGDIDLLGLNTLNIPVVIDIRNLSASDMSIDDYSKKQAIRLIKKLRGKNINVILEPYPWIDNGSKYETEWLPKDLDDFFYNWKTKVLKPLIEDIAEPYFVEAINIGSSFTKIEGEEEQFCDMVDYVKRYYNGLVTYRTSWWKTVDWSDASTKKIQKNLKLAYEKKLNNKLFGELDFISIAAYFELTENDTNTVDNLVDAIYSTKIYNRKQNVKQEIENFYTMWNKPIFFGELGFSPLSRASFAPWDPHPSDIVNGLEQANCFEAYKRVFENEKWHLGFSIFAIGSKKDDNNYYPSNESIEVIKQWYSN